jgi:hypothetical protein|tara:strand:+ start:409 stop:1122 length:714 start_codon:yes stop_codon:yes gene_type:complete
MYKVKNYLLSMQSHWMINHTTYQAVQDSVPEIIKYKASEGVDDMGKTPIHDVIKRIHPDIYRVPLFRRKFCKMLMKEIEHMQKEVGFEPNSDEDELRQIPEIVLREHAPELYRSMWFVVQTVLNPIFNAVWQRDCKDPASIQIANYNLKDKQQGSWHHDDSADISVVVPLNTGKYEGGGTAFHNYGEIAPLPTGHALFFPSFTNLHKGLPVQSGDRYLLVFWLNDAKRIVDLYQEIV